jgi:hypothetical protein
MKKSNQTIQEWYDIHRHILIELFGAELDSGSLDTLVKNYTFSNKQVKIITQKYKLKMKTKATIRVMVEAMYAYRPF